MRKYFFGVLLLGPIFILLIVMPLAFAQEERPIKIGFSGRSHWRIRPSGKGYGRRVQSLFGGSGIKMGGRKVDFLVEDDGGTPGAALTKARKLVELNRIDLLTGEALAASGYSLSPT